ncbi:MAG: hypothetical protein H7Z74_18870 [Anaerolineae bacterium]|nr:hypothetical protein [Gemmatimonadaceae bacterium]
MNATVESACLLDAMSHDFAPAMRAGRGEHMDSALEGVEGVRFTLHRHSERFVIAVAAGVAAGHLDAPG